MVRSRNASRKRLNKRRVTSRKSSRKSLRKKKNIRRKVLRNKRGGAYPDYPDYVQTKIDEINRAMSGNSREFNLKSLSAILFGENYETYNYKTKIFDIEAKIKSIHFYEGNEVTMYEPPKFGEKESKIDGYEAQLTLTLDSEDSERKSNNYNYKVYFKNNLPFEVCYLDEENSCIIIFRKKKKWI